jgi:hypothetical protein
MHVHILTHTVVDFSLSTYAECLYHHPCASKAILVRRRLAAANDTPLCQYRRQVRRMCSCSEQQLQHLEMQGAVKIVSKRRTIKAGRVRYVHRMRLTVAHAAEQLHVHISAAGRCLHVATMLASTLLPWHESHRSPARYYTAMRCCRTNLWRA